MRLFADECVAATIIRRLRSEGFDVVAASEACPTADDDEVLSRAYSDDRVLIAADKDFGELVVRLRHPTRGVVSLALGDLPVGMRADIAAARLAELGDRILDSFVTIEPARVRVRSLSLPGL